jgi:RimJ/RimL family protein N-acetyltransferase
VPTRIPSIIAILSSDAPSRPHTEPPATTRARFLARGREARTKHNAVGVLACVDGAPVGMGNIVAIEAGPPSLANVGIMLMSAARGQGIGKALLRVLLRLANEVDVDVIEAGTMKGNRGMRALAASVGLVETEEVKRRGDGNGEVVAEVMYKDIEREKWRDVELEVEFLEEVDWDAE